jgi:tRNA threonylcarbamoyladenosine biosynthesis protein TsaB
MNTLAIDTATTALGLCLDSDSGTPRPDTGSGTPRPGREGSHRRSVIFQIGLKHSERLMPAVRMLLQQADLPVEDLDLIICSTGPGSFTGIRIGLATAKGLADGGVWRGVRPSGQRAAGGTPGGTSRRLIGVSTLDGLAYRYRRFPGLVAAVNPSLRKKYYAAVYRAGNLDGNYLETTLPDLCAALETRRPLLLTGAAARELYELMLSEGADAGPELVLDASGQPTDPAGLLACGLTRLGDAETEPVPLYLRKSEAEITFFGE